MYLRGIWRRNKDGSELGYVRSETTLRPREILSALDIPEPARFLTTEPA